MLRASMAVADEGVSSSPAIEFPRPSAERVPRMPMAAIKTTTSPSATQSTTSESLAALAIVRIWHYLPGLASYYVFTVLKHKANWSAVGWVDIFAGLAFMQLLR